jgi:MFS family permease
VSDVIKPLAASSVCEAFDNASMTWRHYAFWFIASGGGLLDGFSVVALGVALPLLKRDFVISPLLVGLIGSALVLGAVLGAALGGGHRFNSSIQKLPGAASGSRRHRSRKKTLPLFESAALP